MAAGEEELSAKCFTALFYLIIPSYNLWVDSIIPILTKTEFQKFYVTYLNSSVLKVGPTHSHFDRVCVHFLLAPSFAPSPSRELVKAVSIPFLHHSLYSLGVGNPGLQCKKVDLKSRDQ